MAKQSCSAEYVTWKTGNSTRIYYQRPGDPNAAVLKTCVPLLPTTPYWAWEAEQVTISPSQYQRCAAQKPHGEVEGCVTDSVAKLKWIVPDLYIWGGGGSCPSHAPLYVTFVFKMIIEVLEVIGEIWLAKRRQKTNEQTRGGATTGSRLHDQPFSFSRLLFSLLQGIGWEALVAFLLYREAFVGFFPGLLAVFLFTPRAVPFTAALAGLAGAPVWGVQKLLVDGMVAMLAVSALNPVALRDAPFTLAPPRPQGADMPPAFPALFYGLFVANYPAYLLLAAYFLVAAVLPFMAVVFLCRGREKRPKAKACVKMFFLLLMLIVYPWVVPILALAEIIFNLVHRKNKSRRFGPVRWVDELLEGVSQWKLTALAVLYWMWCLLAFVIFVGRWMVIVNLFTIAGDVFCPSSLKEFAGGGIGVVIALVVGNLGLQKLGLSY